jgi:hypothetical protein
MFLPALYGYLNHLFKFSLKTTREQNYCSTLSLGDNSMTTQTVKYHGFDLAPETVAVLKLAEHRASPSVKFEKPVPHYAQQLVAKHTYNDNIPMYFGIALVAAIFAAIFVYYFNRKERAMNVRSEINEHKRELVLQNEVSILRNRTLFTDKARDLETDYRIKSLQLQQDFAIKCNEMKAESNLQSRLIAMETKHDFDLYRRVTDIRLSYERALLNLRVSKGALTQDQIDQELSALRRMVQDMPEECFNDDITKDVEEVMQKEEELLRQLSNDDLHNISIADPSSIHPRMKMTTN